MNAAKIINGILSIFIIMPIWYYLMYKILITIQATDLMWFLYWIYVPVGVLCGIITGIVNHSDES